MFTFLIVSSCIDSSVGPETTSYYDNTSLNKATTKILKLPSSYKTFVGNNRVRLTQEKIYEHTIMQNFATVKFKTKFGKIVAVYTHNELMDLKSIALNLPGKTKSLILEFYDDRNLITSKIMEVSL